MRSRVVCAHRRTDWRQINSPFPFSINTTYMVWTWNETLPPCAVHARWAVRVSWRKQETFGLLNKIVIRVCFCLLNSGRSQERHAIYVMMVFIIIACFMNCPRSFCRCRAFVTLPNGHVMGMGHIHTQRRSHDGMIWRHMYMLHTCQQCGSICSRMNLT